MALTIIISPLWSAYNDAYAREDYDWMLSIYKKLLKINALVVIGILLMIILSPIVYKLWIGNAVYMPLKISILIGLYMMAQSISNLHSSILNGMGTIRLQIIQALVQGLIYVPLVIILAKSEQLVGILWALLIVAIIPAVVLPVQVVKLLHKNAKGIWSK